MNEPPFHPNCRCVMRFDNDNDHQQRFLDEISERCDWFFGFTDPSMAWLAAEIEFVIGTLPLPRTSTFLDDVP